MTTQAKCRAVAEAAGMDFDYTPGDEVHYPTLQLYSPPHRVFNTSGCHCDCSIAGDYGRRALDWRDTLAALRAIVAAGFSVCPDGEACDVCAEDD